MLNNVKEQISNEQWDEVSNENKLIFWSSIVSKENFDVIGNYNWLESRPTIGSMINFLGDEWYKKFFSECSDGQLECMISHYSIYIGLCDELWKLVKEKLNSNS